MNINITYIVGFVLGLVTPWVFRFLICIVLYIIEQVLNLIGILLSLRYFKKNPEAETYQWWAEPGKWYKRYEKQKL